MLNASPSPASREGVLKWTGLGESREDFSILSQPVSLQTRLFSVR